MTLASIFSYAGNLENNIENKQYKNSQQEVFNLPNFLLSIGELEFYRTSDVKDIDDGNNNIINDESSLKSIKNNFSTYLMIKKKILYVQKFCTSSVESLVESFKKNDVCFASSQETNLKGKHILFLNYVFCEILNYEDTTQTNKLSEAHDVQISQLISLLSSAPTVVFDDEKDLHKSYPHFYQDYQSINLSRDTDTNKTQKILSGQANHLNISDDFMQSFKVVFDDFNCNDHTNITDEKWIEITKALKERWGSLKSNKKFNQTLRNLPFKNDQKYGPYLAKLITVSKTLFYDEDSETIIAFGKNGEPFNFYKEFLDFYGENPGIIDLTNFCSTDDEKLNFLKEGAEKLKERWDPEGSKNYKGLESALKRIAEKKKISPEINLFIQQMLNTCQLIRIPRTPFSWNNDLLELKRRTRINFYYKENRLLDALKNHFKNECNMYNYSHSTVDRKSNKYWKNVATIIKEKWDIICDAKKEVSNYEEKNWHNFRDAMSRVIKINNDAEIEEKLAKIKLAACKIYTDKYNAATAQKRREKRKRDNLNGKDELALPSKKVNSEIASET
ncbi:MAG: hypothetical protein KC505_03415 [Myxococcales bacterium]|nr:hypothetical protein [Myxococcales bacterium]USN50716.1 MAG: hypothetical protein H6731_10740 [Myxococcales bacterium]